MRRTLLHDSLLRSLALLVAVAFGMGCGGRPKPRPPKVVKRASQLSADAYAHYLRGRLAFFEGDLKFAVSELLAAQKAAPNEVSITIALASALYELGEGEQALGVSTEATKRWPKSFPVWIQAGDLQRGMAHHAKAEKHYRRAIQQGARSEAIYLAYAKELQIQGKTKVEEAQYRKLLAKTDGSAELHYRLALLLHEKGKHAAATKHARRATVLGPYDLRIWALLSTSLSREGREEEALAALRQPFDRSSGNALVADGLLTELLDLANHKAASALASTLDRDDLPIDSRIGMGHMQLRLGDFSGALSTAAGLDQDLATSAAIAELRSRALRALGRSDEAKAQLQSISKSQKGYALLRAMLAELLADAGEFAEAEKVVEEALQARPDNAELVLARASVKEKSGDRDAARILLRGIIQRHPKAQRPRFALAELETRDGNSEAAISLIGPLLERNPRDFSALNYVGYSLIGDRSRWPQARALLLRALELSPDSAFILDSYGWLLLKSGELEQAAKFLERAARLSGTEPELILHLAELRWQQEKQSEALSLLARAESLALDRRMRGKIQRRRQILSAKP